MPLTTGFTTKKVFSDQQQKPLATANELPNGCQTQKRDCRDFGAITTKRASYPTIPSQSPSAAMDPDNSGDLLKRPKKFVGAQASPMNVAAISNALTSANS